MNNVLYQGTIIAAGDSIDGESPTTICVTQENNGYAIWRHSPEEGTVCVKHEIYVISSNFIEEAVGMVQKERALLKRAA